MKKDSRKRLTVFLLAVVIAFGSVFMPSQVEAASKPHMKTVNVKWDLKKNKTVIYKTRCPGLGMVKQKAKITNYKVKNSKKKGYKELTFTVYYTRQWNISKNQVHKVANAGGDPQMDMGYYYAILDYDTGKLVSRSRKNVTVCETGKTFWRTEGYHDDHGCSVSIGNVSVNVKVTYPKNYKGLCIGIGGFTTLKGADKMFVFGRKAFGETNMYSRKDKSVAHFMRIK